MAVSIDQPETRHRIPEYLQKNNLQFRPFVATREENPFDISFVGSLFVVDRQGRIAGVPSEFFSGDFVEGVERRTADLLNGKPTPGPLLASLDRRPEGFGILWSQPLTTTVQAVAIAPASAGRPAEIGVYDGEKLRRYSAAGALLDQVNLDNPPRRPTSLQGVDLDGDGRNEWITLVPSAMAYGNMQILSPDGDRIDGTYGRGLSLGGVRDLDRDGIQEIVLRSNGEILARRPWPGVLWRTGPLKGLQALQPDPGGGFLVQRDGKILSLDDAGRLSKPLFRAPEKQFLAGSLRLGPDTVDLFDAGRLPESIDFRHDLDGDGRPEILLSQAGGLVAYGTDGTLELVVRIQDVLMDTRFAAAELDGRSGDELVVVVPHFGLVALGRGPAAASRAAGR